jgi:hypothetical protein
MDLHLLKKDTKEEDGAYFYKSNLKVKIFTSKIKWIEAFGDYVRVVRRRQQPSSFYHESF